MLGRTADTGAHEGVLVDRVDGWVTQLLTATAVMADARLEGICGVVVSTRTAGRPRTVGASTGAAAEIDRIQLEVGDGPGLTALRTGRAVHVADLAADLRWGDYGRRAASRGAASSFAAPSLVNDGLQAVLEVFSPERDGFGEARRRLVEGMASELAGGLCVVSGLYRQALDLEDMTAAMANRRSIDLALGILMERAQVSADVAFDLLRTQSQHRNQALHVVAREVVASLPGAGVRDVVPHFNPRG